MTPDVKLLYATTHLPPDNHFGGVVRSGHAMITALRRISPNVSACCVSRIPDAIKQTDLPNAACSKSIFFHRWGFAPTFPHTFKKMAKQANIIAINGILTYPMTVAGTIAKNLNKPYIVSLRGGLLPEAFRIRKWRKRVFYNLFIKSILNNASLIHVTSNIEHDCLKNNGYHAPIAVIPNGANMPPENIDPDDALPGRIRQLSQDTRLVLFIGRLEPIKGLDLLLNAWADNLTQMKNSNATLVIAGPDERHYARKLKAMAHRLNIAEDVIFLGMLNDPAKWSLYNRADLLVLPSYSESFGLVVTEAFACGVPVITTTATPWSQIADANAGKCVPPERTAMGRALCQMLEMPPSQRQLMGRNGRKIILENYTWDIAAKKMFTACQNILAGQPIEIASPPKA